MMLRWVFFAVITISGCSTQPMQSNIDWIWQITGKVYYKTAAERGSANFFWQHATQLDNIQLSGPLGQGASRIVITPDNASLLEGGKTVASADTIDALLANRLPWQIPLETMRNWLSTPNPAPQFSENSWQFTSSKLDSRQRPTKIVAQRDDYQLTLLISKWQP